MKEQLTRDGIKALLRPFRLTAVMAVTFFVAAGRLDLPRAWLFFGIYFVGAVLGAVIMWRYAPGLANQRASIGEGTKTWDKVFLAIYFPVSLVIVPMIAGLDVGRFRWSQLGGNYMTGGIALYAVCFVLVYWAMVANEHFEVTVRIQKERKHRVINRGPYRFLRHPGYLAMILGLLSPSFVIGSLYSLIPVGIAVFSVVIRTDLEDKMLRRELEGYTQYATKTRYRMIPGVW